MLTGNDAPVALCGNKCDLESHIDEDELYDIIEGFPRNENGERIAKGFRVSAMTNEGIDVMFNEMLPLAIKEKVRIMREDGKPVPKWADDRKNHKKSCTVV